MLLKKRQAYCLTTTKRKYPRTMLHRLAARLRALVLLLLVSACIETPQDRAQRASYASESGYPAVPNRDHFVGSIYFQTASARLTRAASADLTRMAMRIKERGHAGFRVLLVGYADTRRGIEENSELAAERAQNVAIALEKLGIELERIVIDGRPVRLSKTGSRERRVDIYLEQPAITGGNTLYPILVAVFLLTVFVAAALIFRRRR
jgi:outer membrane protein OmpA-like peptidoglycan-associated protein